MKKSNQTWHVHRTTTYCIPSKIDKKMKINRDKNGFFREFLFDTMFGN